MARNQSVVMGTSAYELERWGALPEIGEAPRREDRAWEAAPPREAVRTQVRGQTRAQRQSVSAFAVMGWLLVCILLLLVVLSQLQLAMISDEMGQLDRQRMALEEAGRNLREVHETAFGIEAERIAREELGMVDAARGQVVFIGSSLGDAAEVLQVAAEEETQAVTGLFTHLVGLLREYLPFLS